MRKRALKQHTGEEKVFFLSHSDLFGQLALADIQELERITGVITSPPGRILYRPGETGTALFLLQAGQVQLYHLSSDGRKLITATLGAGSCFGELPVIGQSQHLSFAEVMEDTCLYVITNHDLEQLLVQKPLVALALLRSLGQRLTQLEMQLVNTTFKSATARLAALLLNLASPASPAASSTHPPVIEGLSHEALAERLGVYRETVSAALRELKESGAIDPGRKHITISNSTLLAEVAASVGKSGRS